MLNYVFDILFVSVLAGATWLLLKRTVLESATLWLAFLLSGLVALVCFEPLAEFASKRMFLPSDVWFTCFFWFAIVILIFAWLTTMLFIGLQKVLSGTQLTLGALDLPLRWFFSLLSGYTLAAFLLVCVHTFPASRDFAGALPPEPAKRVGPIMRFAPDYQFLSLAEYVCNPRQALSGLPWRSRGPLAEMRLDENRWASFPVRYALWRESTRMLLDDYGEEVTEEPQLAPQSPTLVSRGRNLRP